MFQVIKPKILSPWHITIHNFCIKTGLNLATTSYRLATPKLVLTHDHQQYNTK